ncbi:MAG: AmmeMemoRadiSam system protein B [Candidatus Omnitrophica bacterium]|nr:AmmeMemoRadiSam system protein B [Candidatus Omnitrophota bacterium]
MHRITLVLVLVVILISSSYAGDVKKADLAGSWYPSSKTILESSLKNYIERTGRISVDGDIFAVIIPHAGYQFSGPVAAYAFKAVAGRDIKTVVVIGFSHRNFFDGVSVYDRDSFATPLGDLPVDTLLAQDMISKSKRVSFYPQAFLGENSIEMALPFIKMVLPGAKIVPVVFGTSDFNDASILADALTASIGGKDGYLVVASTDLSHYHPYDEAVKIDKRTISVISRMNGRDLYDEAEAERCELCGVMPVTATLLAAEKMGYDKIKILDSENSGDTFGDKSRVVGYVSAAIYRDNKGPVTGISQKEADMLSELQKKRLLEIARESIVSFVKDGKRKAFLESDPALKGNLGAFVTLHEDGELRGCIGSMVGQGPLYKTVADMAIEAATGDPRFKRLSASELDKIDIEISVLSPLVRVKSYEDIKIPGHGVIVKKGFSSGVYLPQVATETGWNKEEFLTSLCGSKAGIKPDAWKDPATEMYIFTAEIFGEKDGAH